MERKNTNNILFHFAGNIKNRGGDVYLLFEDGRREMIGSQSKFENITFANKGEKLNDKDWEDPFITEIIPDDAFDSISDYIPYVKDSKLIIPRPEYRKRASQDGLQHYDGNESTPSVFPEVSHNDSGISVAVTIVQTMSNLEQCYRIHSYWTKLGGEIKPAFISL